MRMFVNECAEVGWDCAQKYDELTWDGDRQQGRSRPLTYGIDVPKCDFRTSTRPVQSCRTQFRTVHRARLLSFAPHRTPQIVIILSVEPARSLILY
jgi:hypothetical protein